MARGLGRCSGSILWKTSIILYIEKRYGVLAQMAYFIGRLVPRIYLYSARWQPSGLLIQFRNLFAVWLATGLWHGASWNFILWGLYFGVFVTAEKLFLLKWLQRSPRVVGHVYTLLIVIIGWVLFEYENLGSAAEFIGTMFGYGTHGLVDRQALYDLSANVVVMLVLTLCATPLPRKALSFFRKKGRWQELSSFRRCIFCSCCCQRLSGHGNVQPIPIFSLLKEGAPMNRYDKIYKYVMAVLLLLFIGALAVLNLLTAEREFSEAENRVWEKRPDFTLQSLAAGNLLPATRSMCPSIIRLPDAWIGVKTDADRAMGKRRATGCTWARTSSLFNASTRRKTGMWRINTGHSCVRPCHARRSQIYDACAYRCHGAPG